MTKESVKELLTKRRKDIIVIASLLLLSLVVMLVVTLTREVGAYVTVTHNEKTIGAYPLSIDGVYSLNGGTNTLTVKGGKAYITHSTCPTHSCEKYKARYVGESIVCLPNDITVTITGVSDDSIDFMPGG